MNPGLARLLLALAAVAPAYACFVYGWQLVSFTGFAVRLDDDLPGEAWRSIGLSAAQMIAIAVALFVVWHAGSNLRWGRAAVAMALAWASAAPLFATILRP